MAGAQDIALAIAVAHEGGLGGLPCAMLAPDTIRSEVARFRHEAKGAPLNLNFFSHRPEILPPESAERWQKALDPYYRDYGIDPGTIGGGVSRQPFNAELAELVAELRPEVVSFHFGLPESSLLERVKKSGAKILSTATTVDEALWLEDHGADAIIAQGLEAGGHRGHFLSKDLTKQMGLLSLLPQTVDAVKIPVIATGGITEARSAKAAFDLGAAAVQVGTAFLLTPEARISAAHRAALQGPSNRETAITNLLSGGDARGLITRLMRELGPLSDLPPPFPYASTALAPLRKAAEAQGLGDFSPLWAGQSAALAKAGSVREVIEALRVRAE